MNKELGAHAFTHGSEIYYGAGKSPGKDELTAHELTHTIQQGAAKSLQAKSLTSLRSHKEPLQAKINPVRSPNSTPESAIQPKQNPLQQKLSNKEGQTEKASTVQAKSTAEHLQAKAHTALRTTEQPKSDKGAAKSSLLLRRLIQTKLNQDSPDEESEQEASPMTDAVRHMPATPPPPDDESPNGGFGTPNIQRYQGSSRGWG